MNFIASNTSYGRVSGEMTYTDELISGFYLATLFTDFKECARVARALSDAEIGLETVGDLRNLTLTELREAMREVGVRKKDQVVFLTQLRDSHVFPRGIFSEDTFRIS
jgi:hypothetical protein